MKVNNFHVTGGDNYITGIYCNFWLRIKCLTQVYSNNIFFISDRPFFKLRPISFPVNISREDTNVARPTKTREYYLGDLISGTYCSRIFSDCDRKNCRLQSPNFPGVYPRNLTCYYAVRQHEVPQGKHALIVVKQPNGQLVSIRSQKALYAAQQQRENNGRELKFWQQCDEVQDYVTVYDGYTTRDPVILRFCGGGVPVPEAISSGPELLVEFTTSPFGTFLQPATSQSLHGFQLQVEVNCHKHKMFPIKR